MTRAAGSCGWAATGAGAARPGPLLSWPINTTEPAIPKRPKASAAAIATDFILVSIMCLITPFERAAAPGEIRPATDAGNAAPEVIALIVLANSEDGTRADAIARANITSSGPSEGIGSRRESRWASRARPRESRPESVPIGQRSCSAAC